jgi:uncharacterized membrane protein
MESKARLFGHPIHQALIVFPLGLLSTAVMFDGVTLITGETRWTAMAFYLIGAGLLFGLGAALFGWLDYTAIPQGTRAKSVGLRHGFGNVVVLLLFGMSWYFRRPNPSEPSLAAFILSGAAFALALITAWLGGELVTRMGIGVSPNANPNAPSSLLHDRF